MNTIFIPVGNISDHDLARFLNHFGDWRTFSLNNKANFINKKTNKILANCIYDNKHCKKAVGINEDFYSEYKKIINKQKFWRKTK